MDLLLFVLGFLVMLFGVPASIIVLIVFAVKRKRIRKPLLAIPICFVASIVLMVVGVSISPDSDKGQNKTNQEIADDKEEILEKENKTEQSNQKTEQKSEEKANTFRYADVTMKYLESKIDYNSIDEKCLFVYFEMTNNSDENESFDYLVTCKAFQNGIELDTNYIFDCDEEKNGSKKIQPGATITVAEVFELGDSADNVTLEIRPFNIWSDRLLFEKEIQITE